MVRLSQIWAASVLTRGCQIITYLNGGNMFGGDKSLRRLSFA